MAIQKQIKVSEKAYNELKETSKSPEYRGRGITGVVDKLIFGEFTTQGSGRPEGTKGIKHKKSRILEKKC